MNQIKISGIRQINLAVDKIKKKEKSSLRLGDSARE
jgi:hypothetical protein